MFLAAVTGVSAPARRKRRRPHVLLVRAWVVSKCLVVLLVCAACVWGGYTVYTRVREADYFRLRTVRIAGNRALTRQDVLYLLALPAAATLFQLDVARMGDRLRRHPYVQTVTIRRQFPGTLTVTLRERVPYLVVQGKGQRVVLDKEGVVLRAFTPRRDSRLPRLMLRRQSLLAPGMHLHQQEVQRALDLVRAYERSPAAPIMRLVALTVEASGASVWTVAPYAFTVRLGEGKIDAQLGRLPPVLQYIAQQNLAVRRVDLSYHKRIIVVPEAL